MSRTTSAVPSRARRKNILKSTKGFRGRSKNCITIARRKLEKGMQYAYRDRRNKKREFSSLWIVRINASAREFGFTYSSLMQRVKSLNLGLNKKTLAMMFADEAQRKMFFSKII